MDSEADHQEQPFIYTKPGNPATLSVPVHANKDLKKGLQIDLMKEAGLTEDDL
jgi:predicted RNA binding protein YcfA (HicA-like mRNA interferase family)